MTIIIAPTAAHHPFGVWDHCTQAFMTKPGKYTVYVGNSADNTPHMLELTVGHDSERRWPGRHQTAGAFGGGEGVIGMGHKRPIPINSGECETWRTQTSPTRTLPRSSEGRQKPLRPICAAIFADTWRSSSQPTTTR